MNSFRVALTVGLLAVVVNFIVPAHGQEHSKVPQVAGANQSGVHDFDFQLGEWRVHHLVKQRADDSQWLEFEGTCSNRSLMGGAANVEDNTFNKPTGVTHEVALRAYDPKT